MDLIDTQVSFDTKYYYSISALVVVIGSSYSYENLASHSGGEGNKNFVEFDFITTPSLKIIEIPLEEFVTRVIEPPPLRPTVVKVAINALNHCNLQLCSVCVATFETLGANRDLATASSCRPAVGEAAKAAF